MVGVVEKVVGVVEKVVGGWRGGEGGWWLALWLVQNNDSKRKTATSKITALLHE